MKKVKSYVKNYLKEVSDDGFSLLELVIAVGVLLVLTVGGLLAYNGITENARKAAVQAAAAEVYTGAVAYDSNGQNYKDAVEEWNGSSKKDKDNKASIVVSVDEDKYIASGEICITAFMPEHDGITASRGSGCDGTPAGDGSENGDDPEITVPATAASCFDFDGETITDYLKGDDGCGSDVVIPETIDNQVVVGIGEYAFNNYELTSVVIPDTLKTIGENAFRNNELTSVDLGSGVETIGRSAFSNNKLTSAVIPDSVVGIGREAFQYNQLTEIAIPDSVVGIGQSAFRDNSLTSINLGDGVKTIGDLAFYDNNLTSVEFPNGLETIGDSAFESNELESVVFPSTLKTIGDRAFAYNALTSVEFPNGLETIGYAAFENNQLTIVYVSENTEGVYEAFDYDVDIDYID